MERKLKILKQLFLVQDLDHRPTHFFQNSFLQNMVLVAKKLICLFFCPTQRYLRMFDPQYGDSVVFIGNGIRPAVGSIPTTAEMQARLFALVVSEKRILPSMEVMEARIKRDLYWSKRDFSATNDSWKSMVNWIPFMDSLAKEIGCLPNRFWMFTSPRLWLKLLIGPMTTFHYRLTGPGSKPKFALDIIQRLPIGSRINDLLFFFSIHVTLSLISWPIYVIQIGLLFPLRQVVEPFLNSLFAFAPFMKKLSKNKI